MPFPPPDYEPPSISSIAPPPKPRPSLPVRAARSTAKQSPGLLVGAAIVEFLHYVLPLLRELF